MKDYPKKYDADTNTPEDLSLIEGVYAGPEILDVYNGPEPYIDPVEEPQEDEDNKNKPADHADRGPRGVISRLTK